MTDDDCTSGLQCWPWWKHRDSDPAPLASACDLPYFGPVADDWLAFTGIAPTPGVSIAPLSATGICFAKAVDGQRCDPDCFDCAAGLECVGGVCERPCNDPGDCCRGGVAGSCEADQFCDICVPSRVPVAQCGTAGLGCCRADEGHSCNDVTLVGGITASMCCVTTGSPTACDADDDCCEGARCNPSTSRCQECTRGGRPLPGNGICCTGTTAGPDPQGVLPGTFCLAPCDEPTGSPCRPCAGTTTPTHWGTWQCTVSGSRCVPVMDWPGQDLTCDGVDDDCDGRVDDDFDDTSDDDCNGVDDDCDGTADDDFEEGAMCEGATVSGCSGTYSGFATCTDGEDGCEAQPSLHYCKFGAGASSSEHVGDCHDGADPCCSLPSLSTISHGLRCAADLAGIDRCAPEFQCRHTNRGLGGHWWSCTPRSAAACGSNTLCWTPKDTNADVSGMVCGDGSVPPP